MKTKKDITNYCKELSIVELRHIAFSLGVSRSFEITKKKLIENIVYLLLAYEPAYVNQTVYLTGRPVVDFIRFLCDNQKIDLSNKG